MSAFHGHSECFCPLCTWPGPRPGEATRGLLLQLSRTQGGCCPSPQASSHCYRLVGIQTRNSLRTALSFDWQEAQHIRSGLEKGDRKCPPWPLGTPWHQTICGALSCPSLCFLSFSTPSSCWESQCGLVNINSGNTQASLESSVTPELMLTFPLDEPTEFPAGEGVKLSPLLCLPSHPPLQPPAHLRSLPIVLWEAVGGCRREVGAEIQRGEELC